MASRYLDLYRLGQCFGTRLLDFTQKLYSKREVELIFFFLYHIKLTPSQGRELEQISFARVGEIREFSLPNTDLYVIESSSPVLVYRLSFAAPNQTTGINDVITPCLDSVFSKTSLRNSAGYLFSRDDLDYKHLVIREYTGDGIPSGKAKVLVLSLWIDVLFIIYLNIIILIDLCFRILYKNTHS